MLVGSFTSLSWLSKTYGRYRQSENKLNEQVWIDPSCAASTWPKKATVTVSQQSDTYLFLRHISHSVSYLRLNPNFVCVRDLLVLFALTFTPPLFQLLASAKWLIVCFLFCNI